MGREKLRDREQEIFALIPEDGKIIQFKKLLEKSKQSPSKIGHTVLAKYLDILEESALIARIPIVDEKGRAGIGYKRLVQALTLPGSSETISFYKWIENAVKKVNKSAEGEEKEETATFELYSIFIALNFFIHNELMAHAKNNNKEQADKRLQGALKDFILPMIEQITPLSDMPAACSVYADNVIKEAIAEGIKHWGYEPFHWCSVKR